MAMNIKYDVNIPLVAKMPRGKSVEVEKILEFLDSPHRTMCLEYSNKEEATRKAANLRGWKKNHDRDDFNLYKLDEVIYFEKIAKKGRKGNVRNEDQ